MIRKLEYVTREVWRIVRENSPNFHKTRMVNEPELQFFNFNTISGRHEIECFFGIEFEQEQVDAWTTVQNIIDDVMNLWTSPITDPVVKGANLDVVERLQRQLGESEAEFNEHVKSAIKPSAAINRIEREDVEHFRQAGNRLFNTYQRIATKSAIYPGKGTPFGLMYAALGLAEAGEVQNKVKKAFRDDNIADFHSLLDPKNGPNRVIQFGKLTDERRTQIIKELGGALWYIVAVCDEIGATMSEVALTNLDELCGRGERNTLRGDGDNR